MKPRSLFILVALLFVGLCTGCVSMGGGIPAGHGEVKISNRSLDEIQAKAEEVFHRHGFQMVSLNASEMRFERAGGTTDNILYGNWNENRTVTHVKVFVTATEDAYVLRLRSEVVRNTFGGDSNARMFDLQGGRYGVILRKIRSELM